MGVLVALITLAACGSADQLAEPIGRFQTATLQLSSVTREYMTGINQVERRYNFMEALIDPTIRIEDTYREPDNGDDGDTNDEVAGGRRFLLGEFSEEEISARMQMLEAINAYVSKLAKIAGSDASSRLTTNVSSAAENIRSLIQNATGNDNARVKEYVGALSALVSFLGTEIIEAERREILTSAIDEGGPAVTEILNLLESDLTYAFGSRRSAIQITYNNLRLDYNEHAAHMNFSERRERLAQLEELANSLEQIESINPVPTIVAMRRTHGTLLRVAEDLGNIEDADDFFEALELYATRAELLFSAFSAIER
ncbi:MAG: hypothetical protein H6842_06975 [Rhodospirillaceae bacterium]|nr:hypothetical protein [Rhodospirillaceae bacterium]